MWKNEEFVVKSFGIVGINRKMCKIEIESVFKCKLSEFIANRGIWTCAEPLGFIAVNIAKLNIF